MKTLIGIFRSFVCWGPCPCIKYSHSTRIIYTVILIIQIIFLLLIKLGIIPTRFYCGEQKPELCNVYEAYYAIYQAGAGFFFIFLIYGGIHLRVKSSRDLRSSWHNGFWLLKILIFILSDYLSVNNFIAQFIFYTDIYLGYISTLIMIVLEFTMLWKLGYAISIHLLKRFNEGSIHSGAILVFIGVTTYSIPIFFSIMSLSLFDDNTMNNEIYWGTLFISYAFALIYFSFNLFKSKKSRLLLGGTLASHVVFTMTSAMLHDSYNLYKKHYYIRSIYYMLHSTEIAVAFACVGYFIVFGLKKKQPDMENAILTVEENEKQVCCYVQRKVVEVKRPAEAQESDDFPKLYATTDLNDDEYTRVQYSWSNFYFILGVFFMFMAAAVTNWYYLDFNGKSKEALVFNNPCVKWIKFISSWICMTIFIIFAIKTEYWEYDEE